MPGRSRSTSSSEDDAAFGRPSAKRVKQSHAADGTRGRSSGSKPTSSLEYMLRQASGRPHLPLQPSNRAAGGSSYHDKKDDHNRNTQQPSSFGMLDAASSSFAGNFLGGSTSLPSTTETFSRRQNSSRPQGVEEHVMLPPASTRYSHRNITRTAEERPTSRAGDINFNNNNNSEDRRRLARHRFLMEQLYSGHDEDLRQNPARQGTSRPPPEGIRPRIGVAKAKGDLALLRESHRFLRDDDDEDDYQQKSYVFDYNEYERGTTPAGGILKGRAAPGGGPPSASSTTSHHQKLLARQYYDRLFKEYVLADLRGYKKNQIGFRWRTEGEVKAGKGQFVCGNKVCAVNVNLRNYEVNFVYREQKVQKQALVKIKLCTECAFKLNYVHLKKRRKEAKEAKRKVKRDDRKKRKKKRKRGRGSSREAEGGAESDSSSDSDGAEVQEPRSRVKGADVDNKKQVMCRDVLSSRDHVDIDSSSGDDSDSELRRGEKEALEKMAIRPGPTDIETKFLDQEQADQ